jgi:cobalt-zinc-cadmium efflux system protein
MSNHHENHNSEENIKIAFFLNLVFAIVEIIGGFLTNSMAILADALHDFGDSISLAFSWRMEILSQKKGDLKYSYGYARFSLLSALISAIVLTFGSIYVITESISRIKNPQRFNAQGMLIFSLVGIAINGYAVFRTSQGKNMNSKVISWHLWDDVLTWAAVLILSIILLINKELYFLDPLLSLAVTVFILYNVIKNLKDTLSLFLQGVPGSINISAIEEELKKMDMVNGIHHTHVWSLDGEHHVLTTHIMLCTNAKKEQIRAIKNKIKELSDQYGLSHTTVEFEYMEEDCSMNNCNGKSEKRLDQGN